MLRVNRTHVLYQLTQVNFRIETVVELSVCGVTEMRSGSLQVAVSRYKSGKLLLSHGLKYDRPEFKGAHSLERFILP